ncbi:Acg family FMN-binding oxidoreductase [Micromonospora sp. WMMD736]|uniref:Acg family FMN-binding oxidoreductase n=1 Tax=Micromonospora sp. WMMD736 TaxID=3404112 RepID=UPI003B962B05
MSSRFPDPETLRAALSLAIRAPSVHNSQPWRWKVGPHSLHLWTDPDRHLPNTDPDRRDLLLSCGAALNHCAIALAALGWQPKIHRCPNPDEPLHLASIEVIPHQPTDLDVGLAAAIPRRRTDRRLFSDWSVPYADIALMSARAARAGVKLICVEDLTALKELVVQAAHRHGRDDDYLRELASWSGRHASVAGVPARNTPVPDTDAKIPSRFFAGTALAQPTRRSGVEQAVVLALGTTDDDDLARLRAGEATSLVLLTATAQGLASCPITEPLEFSEIRETVRADVFGGGEHPQMLLRIGWAPMNADPLPATPRWPLADVVTRLNGQRW